MDNGDLQKSHALKLKQIVGQNNHKRRKSQALRSTSLPFPGMNVIENKVPSPTALPMTVSSLDDNTYVSTVDDTFSIDWSQVDSWPTELDLPSADLREQPSDGELNFAQITRDVDALAGDILFDGEETNTSSTSRLSQYPDSIFSASISNSTMQAGKAAPGAFIETEKCSGTSPFSIFEPSPGMNYPVYDTRLARVETIQRSSPLSANFEEAELRSKLEESLFIHYLDDVFNIQFSFYNVPKKRSRGWIFSIFKRSRLVYHATLALSQYSLRSAGHESMLRRFPKWRNHHEIACSESESAFGEMKGSNIIARGIGILQMLFYEIFAGGTGNWRRYLCMASPLVQTLVRTISGSTGVTSDNLNEIIELREDKRGHRDMVHGDDTEIQVVIGSFIWFDIMASASTRSIPTLKLDHQKILRSLQIDLRFLFGCSQRVSGLILDIVHLDDWKQEAQKSSHLSMVELVKRGAKIEENICQHIDDLTSPTRNFLTDGSSAISEAQTAEVTRIFALSAQTYLHVVISGAHPELPEIAKSVSKTAEALKSLSNPRLLRNVIWPLCVTGCLATESQQSIIREVVSKAGITSSTLGSGWQALQIIEKLWETRKNSSCDYDWVYFMKMRSYDILLV